MDNGKLPDEVKFPVGANNALPICSPGATPDSTCLDLNNLAPHYIAQIPVDPLEGCSKITGYEGYKDEQGYPHVESQFLNDQTPSTVCPVEITWSGDTATITGGVATLTGSVTTGNIVVASDRTTQPQWA